MHGVCRCRVVAVCLSSLANPVTCLTQVLCRGIPGAGGVAEAFPGTSLLCSPFTVSEHNYLVLNKLNEEKKRWVQLPSEAQLPCWPNKSERVTDSFASGPKNGLATFVLLGPSESPAQLESDSPIWWRPSRLWWLLLLRSCSRCFTCTCISHPHQCLGDVLFLRGNVAAATSNCSSNVAQCSRLAAMPSAHAYVPVIGPHLNSCVPLTKQQLATLLDTGWRAHSQVILTYDVTRHRWTVSFRGALGALDRWTRALFGRYLSRWIGSTFAVVHL